MQILSVTLKNFKSHRDRHFLFQLGTNAICGENGAGKTSILEAIAWTLFNYRGDYRKEDLICNGEGSAQVTVSFVSTRDGRTYDVQRCTSKGYMIYDPQLEHRLPYTRIDEDVLPWLRQQMGVAPGTDLARLFSNTIGVPQGTFTADFLQPPEKRKQVFDSILKVEEFKRVYTQLGSLKKYSDGLVDTVKREIEHFNETLIEQPSTQAERDRIFQVIEENQTTLKTLDAELATLQSQKDQLSAQAQRVQALSQELTQGQASLDAKQQELIRQQASVTQSQDAVQVCHAHQQGHDAYVKAETALKDLETQSKRYRMLLKERDKQQADQSALQLAIVTLVSQIDALTRSQQELDRLAPFVQQQESLEAQHETCQQTLQHLKRCDLERRNLEQQINLYRGEWKTLAQEIRRIQALKPEVESIPSLEHQRDRLQLQLSRVDAARQFEQELRQLMIHGEQQRDRTQHEMQSILARLDKLQTVGSLPSEDASKDWLSSVKHALENGIDLNTELLSAIDGILSDLGTQISPAALKSDLAAVKTRLSQAYRAQAEVQSLDEKQTRQNEIQAEAEQFQSRIKDLIAEMEQEPNLIETAKTLKTQLRDLNDPRSQCRILSKELAKQAALEASHAQQQQDYDTRQAAIAQLDQELEQFSELDEQIESARHDRQHHQPSYQLFLQHQTLAAQLSDLEHALGQLQADVTSLQHSRDRLQTEYDEICQDYDPNAWTELEKCYGEVRSRADQVRGSLPEQQKRLADYDARLATLSEIQEKRDRAQADLKEKEQIKRFVNFARKVYKDAGPRITEKYVLTVSQEADRLFRELLNRQNVALTWSRDYEILIHEGAHQRRFINLSGGEQMCAALAVRLALLRVLADIDIAFFDEPTTNMDRPRRASLAEAIANIKSFQQLFVISHDDTFEQFTENLVLVEREG